RLDAERALARGGAAPALALLPELTDGADAATQATRARILFRAGRTGEAVQALIARERLVTGPQAALANRRLILDGLVEAAQRGADLRPPPAADALLAGWFELGRIVAEAGTGGFGLQRRIQAWRARYPAHPATEELWRERLVPVARTGSAPGRVALLLPLSGRAAAAGLAVRDGFLGAFYQQDAAARPLLRLYDVSDGDVSAVYRQALADGSDFVVGPLTREDVAALATATDGRSRVLALNFLPEGTRAPAGFYQFALSPEDEARQVARRISADGHRAGVALAPDSDWGRRTIEAFAVEFATLGGRLLDRADYAPDTTDFNDTLRRLLQTSGQRGSAPRADAQFVFVLAQPVAGRLIRSQLRFNYAGALPVYATSDIYEPAGAANLDLDGVSFPDMPWLLDPDGPAAAARAAASRIPGRRDGRTARLYAFGYDAFRIALDLPRMQGRNATLLPGVTGRLGLGGDGRVRRELDWARVTGGQAVPVP
ncbi:MAG: hypothetical protein FJ191_11560, partial [Gammaproteobacteria bacterium]|nr:hypothetical protein [Gammaproteobacteria bacterium]